MVNENQNESLPSYQFNVPTQQEQHTNNYYQPYDYPAYDQQQYYQPYMYNQYNNFVPPHMYGNQYDPYMYGQQVDPRAFYQDIPPQQEGSAPQSNVMQQFLDENGNVDIQKMLSTVGQLADTVQQVTPVVRQLNDLIRSFRA